MPHICVSRSGEHWFRYWLVAYSAPSHYQNQCYQCWFTANWTLRNKFQWNFSQRTTCFIHENASENIVCETVAILSRGRWVNFNIFVTNTNLHKQFSCTYYFSHQYRLCRLYLNKLFNFIPLGCVWLKTVYLSTDWLVTKCYSPIGWMVFGHLNTEVQRIWINWRLFGG